MSLLLVFLFAFTITITGCSNESAEEKPNEPDVENTIEEEVDETEETTMEEEEKSAEEELDEIFEQAHDMDHYYYEVLTETAEGDSFVTKLWSSDGKTKMETSGPQEVGTITIISDEVEGYTYLYMPSENMAIKMPLDDILEIDEHDQADDYIEVLKEIAEDEEIEVEKDTFEGEPVTIVTSETEGVMNKMWISDRTNFPVKTEIYIDEELTMTSTFELFEEKEIDSSVFEIPDDVTIQDMTEQ